MEQGAEAVFKASDLDGDGTLNEEEFSLAIADQQIGFAKFEVRGWCALRAGGSIVVKVVVLFGSIRRFGSLGRFDYSFRLFDSLRMETVSY